MLYGDSTPLSGILTVPLQSVRENAPLIVILNAGIIHKVGPNRLHVRLARHAARLGIGAFRFDFAGIGDCATRDDGRSLSEAVLVDITETLNFLEESVGARSFVLVGLCAGADNALKAARTDSRVVGIVLLDPTAYRTAKWYWYRYTRLLVSSRFWKLVLTFNHPGVRVRLQKLGKLLFRKSDSPGLNRRPEFFSIGLGNKENMERHLIDVVKRKCQLLCVFSGGWERVYNYREQLLDLFPHVNFDNCLRLEHFPQADHTFDCEEHRTLLLRAILDWYEKTIQVKSERPNNVGRIEDRQIENDYQDEIMSNASMDIDVLPEERATL